MRTITTYRKSSASLDCVQSGPAEQVFRLPGVEHLLPVALNSDAGRRWSTHKDWDGAEFVTRTSGRLFILRVMIP